MILWCEHHTISKSCQTPSYQHLTKASLSWISQSSLLNSSTFRHHNLLLQPQARRKHRMRNHKRPHQASMKPEDQHRELVRGGLLTVLQLAFRHPSTYTSHFLVHSDTLNLWIKFWWKKWRTHLNWAVIYCIFYSDFCLNNWSRHEILQWLAESDSRRIHLCAPDTALYAGTGKWVHAVVPFPAG